MTLLVVLTCSWEKILNSELAECCCELNTKEKNLINECVFCTRGLYQCIKNYIDVFLSSKYSLFYLLFSNLTILFVKLVTDNDLII